MYLERIRVLPKDGFTLHIIASRAMLKPSLSISVNGVFSTIGWSNSYYTLLRWGNV